jgi:hypothetical protein
MSRTAWLGAVLLSFSACGGSRVPDNAAPTAPTPAAAATVMCDSFATLDVTGKEYVIQANEWGGDFGQCIEVRGSSFTLTAGNFNRPVSGPPATYPSIFKGCHWGNCTAGSGMPIRVGEIGSATSNWSFTLAPGVFNATYDVWFDTMPAPAGNGQPNRAELMIWLNRGGEARPSGSRVGTVVLSGATWDVWVDTGFPWNLVSYTAQAPATSVSALDIRAFAKDMVTRDLLNDSDYMIAIEAGFEIWSGGIGLTSNTFNASVRPR